MPSLIGQIGPDGTVYTGVAANYRTQQVPYSRFGTRKIVWFNIGLLDNRLGDGSVDPVKLNTLIDTIQTRAEVAIIGAPHLGQNHGRITIGVFEDTFNDGNLSDANHGAPYAYSNPKATTLQDAIREVFSDSATVEEVYLYGGLASEYNDPSGDFGWDRSNVYQEYTTKVEYDDNSYLNPQDRP
jgi:hypothetical protein